MVVIPAEKFFFLFLFFLLDNSYLSPSFFFFSLIKFFFFQSIYTPPPPSCSSFHTRCTQYSTFFYLLWTHDTLVKEYLRNKNNDFTNKSIAHLISLLESGVAGVDSIAEVGDTVVVAAAAAGAASAGAVIRNMNTFNNL